MKHKNLAKILLLLVLSLVFIIGGCSSDEEPGANYTFVIKNNTSTSFTMMQLTAVSKATVETSGMTEQFSINAGEQKSIAIKISEFSSKQDFGIQIKSMGNYWYWDFCFDWGSCSR